MSPAPPVSTQVTLVLVLLAFAAAGTYAYFAFDLASARARVTGRSRIIETTQGTVEYATVGQGEPLLVIHGAAGGFDQGLDMTEAAARHGFELIAPSRFGYLGSTAHAEITGAAQTAAYVELLSELGIGRVSIIAISAGAWSALDFASRYPDRCKALALIVPASQLPPGTRNYGGATVRAMFDSDFITWVALKLTPLFPGTMDGLMLGTDSRIVRDAAPAEQARVQRILDHLLPMRARSEGIAFDIKTAASPPPISLKSISCPVLTVSAEDDKFGTASRARQIAASVPHGKTVIYPTGGHALVGHYDEALSEVTSFLSQAESH
jgi:2-hydroxy-6-oxonona-2,4-dienedioate hydrolase